MSASVAHAAAAAIADHVAARHVDDGPSVPRGAPRVLLIEDNPLHARLVREMLFDTWGTEAEIVHCECMADIEVAVAASVDCTLLDLTLPDSEGLASVRALRSVAPEIPIVVLSSRADEAIALRAVQIGAQDYLAKSTLDASLLSRTIRYAIERKSFEAQLAHLAMHDGLTGLPNRALFLDRVERAILGREARERSVAVFFVDLDGFKGINDSFGHAVGDDVLVTVAKRLRSALRPEDTVARFGGDEFCVLCSDMVDAADAVSIARRIVDALGAPLRLPTQDVWITASIGVAIASSNGTVDADALIHEADHAMYSAKRSGKDRYEIHEHSGAPRGTRPSLDPETALRQAIEDDQLVLHYQPIIDLAANRLAGFEALVRWQHPEHGLLQPNDFVPFAERTGLMVPLGAWVLAEACRQVSAWRREIGPLAISVNLSVAQLGHVQLVGLVASTLEHTRTPPGELWLEVTETGVMQDVDASIRTLDELRRLGVAVTLDDFGTGHSSLAYLSRLPASILKVDRAFVSRLGGVRPVTLRPSAGASSLEPPCDDTVIVSAVVDLAHALGMAVVAEGVESRAQLDRIQSIDCEFAQGYHLARPLPAETIEREWLHQSGS
ncbi:MAG TPA: EAL domain-containing protein [Acidimicrobiales bacterium]|nr:EAL domain-containing protein [Acidimicrobiales bacterium]